MTKEQKTQQKITQPRPLSDKEKKRIEATVQRAVNEYGSTLKLLGQE